MAVSFLKVPAEIRNLVRRLPPELKRKVRAALADILERPGCGKALKENLQGYRSLRVGRSRIIYRPIARGVEIVAIGPRDTIYEDAARQVFREREKARIA
jgi:mRNA interferase RelE/StbE